MIEHPNVIPIAVIVAIGIFLLKELLEYIRRERLNGRKLKAIRRFLAAECERNSFAIQKLNENVREVDEAHTHGWKVFVDQLRNGLPRLTIEDDEGHHGSSIIRPIHIEALQKYFFEVASLNPALFEVMEGTLDMLIEAKHVRESLLEYVTDDPQHLVGFAEYASEELDDALEAIRALYFKCTNEPLAAWRVR